MLWRQMSAAHHEALARQRHADVLAQHHNKGIAAARVLDACRRAAHGPPGLADFDFHFHRPAVYGM